MGRDARADGEFAISGQNAAIAIIGMGAHFGPWQTLAAFRNRLFSNDTTAPTHPTRWWGSPEQSHFTGYFINEINIPLGRFRIPPAELAEMLPQQLLMLQVAADALEDAGLSHTPGERLDTGVFVGIGLDLNTTIIVSAGPSPKKPAAGRAIFISPPRNSSTGPNNSAPPPAPPSTPTAPWVAWAASSPAAVSPAHFTSRRPQLHHLQRRNFLPQRS